ncbi:MAG: hypothetical protein K8R23_18260 [Chthoniobacter sp.]|nr:hypothetical protein [Chthoniobacter sp.]
MRPSNSSFDYWFIRPLRRFAVNSLVVWPMLGVYMFSNHHQPASPSTVLMPAWVPFSPSFIIAYIGLLLMTWLLPMAICDAGLFRACLRANVCAWLLVLPWWILIPTTMARPPLPEEPWTESFRLLWACDQPCNVFPCAHGIGPMVAAWFAGRDHPTWRWPLAGVLALAFPSIALIWQHRPIDILFGVAATVIGIVVGEAMSRRERASLKDLDEIAA